MVETTKKPGRFVDIARNCVALAAASANNHAPMMSSAVFCLNDARALLAKGEPVPATKRALDSLSYSVGTFHPDYNEVRDLVAWLAS
jgi:hypothetical protein